MKTLRGSPKLPRTGCSRLNGLTGQPKPPAAWVWVAAGEVAEARSGPAFSAPTDARTVNVAVATAVANASFAAPARTEVCVLVAMRPPSIGAQIGRSRRANGAPTAHVHAPERVLEQARDRAGLPLRVSNSRRTRRAQGRRQPAAGRAEAAGLARPPPRRRGPCGVDR